MGDISEMRAVVVILAFVGLTVLLVGLMIAESPQMFSDIMPGTSPTSQSTVSPGSLFAWNSSFTLNITNAQFEYPFTLGGWNLRFKNWISGTYLTCESYDVWAIFNWNIEGFSWYSITNILESGYYGLGAPFHDDEAIKVSQLDTDYLNRGMSGLSYQLRNSKTKFNVNISFNTTAYSKPSVALSSGSALTLTLNQDFSERNTSINALNFISGIFTFSLPGIPTIVNSIIWLMLFPPLLYLSFIFVLRILGAVFGGGGA